MNLRLFFVLLLLASCKPRGELREWTAADHQPAGAAAQGQGAGGDEGGDPAMNAAAAVWSVRCASCHGEGGRGDGSGRPPGAPIPDFTSKGFQDARTDAQLLESINSGRGMMPAFGEQLGQAGAQALVRYVRSLAN